MQWRSLGNRSIGVSEQNTNLKFVYHPPPCESTPFVTRGNGSQHRPRWLLIWVLAQGRCGRCYRPPYLVPQPTHAVLPTSYLPVSTLVQLHRMCMECSTSDRSERGGQSARGENTCHPSSLPPTCWWHGKGSVKQAVVEIFLGY